MWVGLPVAGAVWVEEKEWEKVTVGVCVRGFEGEAVWENDALVVRERVGAPVGVEEAEGDMLGETEWVYERDPLRDDDGKEHD